MATFSDRVRAGYVIMIACTAGTLLFAYVAGLVAKAVGWSSGEQFWSIDIVTLLKLLGLLVLLGLIMLLFWALITSLDDSDLAGWPQVGLGFTALVVASGLAVAGLFLGSFDSIFWPVADPYFQAEVTTWLYLRRLLAVFGIFVDPWLALLGLVAVGSGGFELFMDSRKRRAARRTAPPGTDRPTAPSTPSFEDALSRLVDDNRTVSGDRRR